MGPCADAAQSDGGASAARVDGKADRQSARDQNERRIALERVAVIGMTNVIATDARLPELLKKIDAADRVALDTEADRLHSYREKLCLIQISVPAVAGIVDGGRELETNRGHRSRVQHDFIVDPLSNLDLEPLCHALEPREIVLHAADYD